MAETDTETGGSADQVRVVVIGSGFAGLGMGIKLKQAGIDDFVILEQNATLGGTWRDNDYPGAGCDVPSHLYSFSFEPNPRWSRLFARQGEILDYMRHCAHKYGLEPHLRFNSKVTEARFDSAAKRWRVQVNDTREVQAEILVSGSGGLSRPSYPDISGLDRFQGALFHSSRWNHHCDLQGKRVAVIGTGASAIQFVPRIIDQVAHLELFQRTPPWILPKPDRRIGASERRLFRRFPAVQWLYRQLIYWILESRALGFVVTPGLMKLVRRQALKYLRESIADPALRAKLTPNYTVGCKRVLISNDYFPAVQRPNLQLVTDTIEEVEPEGIRTRDGALHRCDVLILGTGFQASEQVVPFPIIGQAGQTLDEAWRDGAEAYLGTAVSGFPNLFMVVGPNTGLGHSSMIFMIESQIQYIADALRVMDRQKLQAIGVRSEVQHRYNQGLKARLDRTVWQTGCKSWYQTASGKNTVLWPGFTFEFRSRTRKLNLTDYHGYPAGRPSFDDDQTPPGDELPLPEARA